MDDTTEPDADAVDSGAVFSYYPSVTYTHAGTGAISDRVATGRTMMGSGELTVGRTGVVS